jgi:hypothetical protein
MSGWVSSVLVWVAATGATALGVAWMSPLAVRLFSGVVRAAWLIVSNVR